jgi:hypothetical protein
MLDTINLLLLDNYSIRIEDILSVCIYSLLLLGFVMINSNEAAR